MADLYKKSGVDINKGEALVDWLKESSDSQEAGGARVSGIGGFAALYRPDFKGMQDPLLISGTDGVGTKVLLALEADKLEGLGVDLVAMCVNDLYCVGGRPLFFLDYYATGVLCDEQFKKVLAGIRKGLDASGCMLMGGETAELPGLYAKGHLDLAGFVVGVVDGPKRLLAENVEEGDSLVSLESSGFHSNGYSLIRHFLSEKKADAQLLEKLMAPTKIYGQLPTIMDAMGPKKIHAMANITGGGISGNLPRVMPKNKVAVIEKAALPTPAWMTSFFEDHNARFEDVEPVFNLGAGMIAVIAKDAKEEFIAAADQAGFGPKVIGHIENAKQPDSQPSVEYK